SAPPGAGGERAGGEGAGADRGEGQQAGAVVVGQGLAGGQVAAGAVDAGPGGRAGPGQVQALEGRAPAPPGGAGPEHELLVDRERAGLDVAAGQAGVGRLQVGRGPGPAGQDPVAEAG